MCHEADYSTAIMACHNNTAVLNTFSLNCTPRKTALRYEEKKLMRARGFLFQLIIKL